MDQDIKHRVTLRTRLVTAAVVVAIGWSIGSAGFAAGQSEEIRRGRYVVQTAGCNDCHTPGYGPKEGQVDENLWLVGDTLGWAGPWGTTYATNLRLLMARLTPTEWVTYARTMKPRPPMPWFNVRAMSDQDLRAIYAYTRSLGSTGEPEPAFVPPGQMAPGPVVRFPD